MSEIAASLAIGFGFGWALHKAGLTHSERIVGVYRLRDATVLVFMLVALLVGGVLIQAAIDLGLAPRLPVPPTFVAANLAGGVIFGIGMATAGYCPGTIVAEAAEGRLDAWIGGFAGLIAGAIGFGLLQPHVMPLLTRVGALGRVTTASLLDVPPWLLLLLLAEVVLLALLASRRSVCRDERNDHVCEEDRFRDPPRRHR